MMLPVKRHIIALTAIPHFTTVLFFAVIEKEEKTKDTEIAQYAVFF